MNTIHQINLAFSAAGIALSIVGLIQTLLSSYLEKGTRRFFTAFFCILGAYDCFILTHVLISAYSEYRFAVLSRVIFFGQAIFSSVLSLLLTGFILHLSGEKKIMYNRIFRINFVLWIVYAGMLTANLFSGKIYTVDDFNHYSRGPLFPLQMVPLALIMAMNLLLLRQKWSVLTVKQKRAFMNYILLPSAAMLVQMWSFGVHLIAISTVIAAIIMYSYIIADQTEQYHKRESENARLKINILLAQIQPHFLFNSLTAIKQLCRKDPGKAEKAIADFTAYLRLNMDSLQSDALIPFDEELKHVQGFLNLQKLRFGNELNVVYDLKYRDFYIPTLTLQPLVENAVTYGVRKSESGTGTVMIHSEAFPDRIEISVEDDGPGFVPDVSPDDRDHPHIGLQNVRQRLEQQCDGKLLIDSELDRGTKVTIVLYRGG